MREVMTDCNGLAIGRDFDPLCSSLLLDKKKCMPLKLLPRRVVLNSNFIEVGPYGDIVDDGVRRKSWNNHIFNF